MIDAVVVKGGPAYNVYSTNSGSPAGNHVPPAEDTPDDIDPEFSGWIYHQFLLDCWMLTSTSMFRREVFERCGAFDETLPFSEDWDLWLRLAREYEFVQLRRPSTLYRKHTTQGSGWHRPVDYRTRLLERKIAEENAKYAAHRKDQIGTGAGGGVGAAAPTTAVRDALDFLEHRLAVALLLRFAPRPEQGDALRGQ